jgi:hypothetical protein
MFHINSLAHMLVVAVCCIISCFHLIRLIKVWILIVYNTLASLLGHCRIVYRQAQSWILMRRFVCSLWPAFYPGSAMGRTAAEGIATAFSCRLAGNDLLYQKKGLEAGDIVDPRSIGLLLGKTVRAVGIFFSAALVIAIYDPDFEGREKRVKPA